MKNKINYLLKAHLIFFSLLFISCETQEEIVKQENHKHIHVSEKSFEELIIDVNFKKSFNKLNKTKSFRSSEEAKSVIENQYGFTITNDVAKVIESDNKTSYTFSISRENTNNLFFENLVIEIDSIDDSKFYIAKYTPSEEVTMDFKNNINFKGDIKINELDSNITNISSKYTTVVIVKSLCNGIPYDCGGSVCGFGLFTVGTYTIDETNSVEGGGSFTGVVISNNNGFSGQSGTGSGTITSSNTNTVLTIPVLPQKTPQEISNIFLNSLSEEQNIWLSNHPDVLESMVDYLYTNQIHDIEENPEQHAENVLNEIISTPIENLPSDVELVSIDVEKVITNINDYLKCFDLNQPAIFTLWVDQPTPNTNSAWSGDPTSEEGPDVGHTFISIKQGSIRRVLGFYPGTPVDLENPSTAGAIQDNSGHSYDVSLSVNIDAVKLKKIINYIKSKSIVNYNLNSYNCTDFGMGATKLAGIPLASAYGTWGNFIIGSGAGDNPGQLGQNIRNMSIPEGVVRTTTTGTALSNIGNCN